MAHLKAIRYVLWALIAVLVGGVSLSALGLWPGADTLKQRATGDVGAPFTLTAMTGEPYSWQEGENTSPRAIFFGFTFCPEICPTTLYEMSTWLQQLGPTGASIQTLFVTVDPERDTPEKLAAYLSVFDDRIVGLTGPRAAIDKVAADFRIYHRKVPLDDGDYTMDHTASILLFRSDGSFFGTIAYQENTDTALEKLKRLAKT